MFDIEYYPWFMLAVLTILSILGLAACSDYDQFTSANGVRMDFIAVQSCVASCWEGFGASGTSSLFCGDKAYDLTGFVTPDFNVSKFRCSGTPVKQCQSCYEKRDEWKHIYDATVFIKLHAYCTWGVYFGMVLISMVLYYELEGLSGSLYRVSNIWVYATRSMTAWWIGIAGTHLGFFSYGVGLIQSPDTYVAAHFMLRYIGQYDTLSIFVACLSFDFLFFLISIRIAWLYWNAITPEYHELSAELQPASTAYPAITLRDVRFPSRMKANSA
jgi:hypothetical protein